MQFATCDIDGATLPGPAQLGLTVQGAQAAHPRLDRLGSIPGRQDQTVADRNLTGKHRPCDDQAGAGNREGAVDREAKLTVHRAVGMVAGGRFQMLAQRIHTGAKLA